MDREFARLDFPRRASGPLALVHVAVVPMDGERTLHDHALVIENGVIRAMAPAAQVDTAGMKVVDASGLYAMPGLADMYTHYWDPADAPLYLGSGITTVRTVGTPFQLALERVAERGEFPSPRMVNVSPPIDGLGPNGRTDMPRGYAMTRADEAPALVERMARVGYRQVKAFSLLTPDNFRALAKAAGAAGVPLTANCPNAMTFEEAAGSGARCFDQLHNVARGHLRGGVQAPSFWDRFDPVPGTQLDFEAIRALARVLAEREVWNVPTLVFHQRDGLPPGEGMKDPALKYVSPISISDWESTLVRWTRRARMDDVEQWRAAARKRAEAFLQVVGIFHEEGVPLLTGSDALNPWNVQGDSLHAELANFVAAGMSPYEALRCATVEAARFLGESAHSGTLAAGKRADLVLLRRDPLAGLEALRHIEAVCVNGYYLERSQLERMLAQRARMAAAPPSLPATLLSPAKDSDVVASHGAWEERIAGVPSGRIAYRHTRLPDGGWLIEERHAASLPRRHTERRNTRIETDADFGVRSCECSVDTFAGVETASLRRVAGGYALEGTELDGSRSEHEMPAPAALPPSERLAATLWPLRASHGARSGAGFSVLDLENGALHTREATFSALGQQWKLKVSRPTHITEQVYTFEPNGRFAGMEETMPLLWLRQVIPDPQ